MNGQNDIVWVRGEVIDSIHTLNRPFGGNRDFRRATPSNKKSQRKLQDVQTSSDEWKWILGIILSTNSSSHQTSLKDSQCGNTDAFFKIKISDNSSSYNGQTFDLQSDSFIMANTHDIEGSLEYPPDDLISLTHLHEPAVVSSLKRRYAKNDIYTATGPILLALNPFKHCQSLYSKEVMDSYNSMNIDFCHENIGVKKRSDQDEEKKCDDKIKNNTLRPHVYGIAERAFQNMIRDDGSFDSIHKNQSILVSGESGAGKTMTTKFIMQYLANLSQKNIHVTCVPEGNNGIEKQVLQSNPILESVGNARTIRNDNSSRFGKFIEIHFKSGGTLIGASIKTYLLEKVRVITQNYGERNYHVFYEILSGVSTEERESLYLYDLTPEDFRITSSSGTYDRRDGVNDVTTYRNFRRAMETMGFSSNQQIDIMTVVCALLHTSNITFVENGTEASALDLSNPFLGAAVTLLGVDFQDLNTALCTCAIVVRGERVDKNLSVQQASKALDAFIKASYSALFNYIVESVNECINVKSTCNGLGNGANHYVTNSSCIGVLDIFGFESFETNGFEQLCINYTNEALQQQFNKYVFKMEQQDYEKEGIKWAFIQFPDNQDVLDLIDKKHTGILSILDEQCRLARCTDRSFANAIYDKCTDHPRFKLNPSQRASGLFSINHYAGFVEYTSYSFLEKNKDELPKETTDLLESSSNPFYHQLKNFLNSSSPDNFDHFSSSESVCSNRSNRSITRKSSSLSRPSVGNQFCNQLRDLRERIECTSPHYIRCLKPNDRLVPDTFDPVIIADQLKCAGVLEAIRVSRVGYPQRYSHDAFLMRYCILSFKELQKIPTYKRGISSCELLVNSLARKIAENMSENSVSSNMHIDLITVGIQIGRTKVFLRQFAFDTLENLRNSKMEISATIIQSQIRALLKRRTFRLIIRSVLMIQCFYRCQVSRIKVQILRENRACLVLQSFFRRVHSRNKFVILKCIALFLQRIHRGNVGRKMYQLLRFEHNTVIIQKYWRRKSQLTKFGVLKQLCVNLQCLYRSQKARGVIAQLRKDEKNMDLIRTERDSLRLELQNLKKEFDKIIKTKDPPPPGNYTNDRACESSIPTVVFRDFPSNPSEQELALNELSQLCLQKDKEIETLKQTIISLQSSGSNTMTTESQYGGSIMKKIYSNFVTGDQNATVSENPSSVVREEVNNTSIDTSENDRISITTSHSMKQIYTNFLVGEKSTAASHETSSVEKEESNVVNNVVDEDTKVITTQNIFTPQKMFAQLAPLQSLIIGKIPSSTDEVAESVSIESEKDNQPDTVEEYTETSHEQDNKSSNSPIVKEEPDKITVIDVKSKSNILASSFIDENTLNSSSRIHEAVDSRDINNLSVAIKESTDLHKDINTGNIDGRTPLHIAVMYAEPSLTQILLENFAIPNAQDNHGDTPLHVTNDLRCIEILFRNGASPNIPNCTGVCPLHLAVQRRDSEAVKIFLDYGADVNAADDIKWYTPLHIISQNDDNNSSSSREEEHFNLLDNESESDTGVGGPSPIVEIAESLCNANPKPDIMAQDKDGNTCLHHCAINPNPYAFDLIEKFFQNDCDPDITNNRDQTALHLYCHNGALRKYESYQETMDLLLQKSNPNKTSQSGCTPIHLALYHQDIDSAVKLVHHGGQLHLPWRKPPRWKPFWIESGLRDTLALDMVSEERALYRILSAIREPQIWAPSRPSCMQCKLSFSTFVRQHHCRHCGRVICGSCSSNSQANSYDFVKKSADTARVSTRICIICEVILEDRKNDESFVTS